MRSARSQPKDGTEMNRRGHDRDSCGLLPDGFRRVLPGGGPRPRGRRSSAFSIGRGPVTVAQFAPLHRGDRLLTLRRTSTRPGRLSRRRPLAARARLGRISSHSRARCGYTTHPLVGLRPGADWRHPWGPASDNSGRDDHPVTHVAYEDAESMRPGLACRCRVKPSGNTRRAAGSTERRSPGATRSSPMAS